MRSRDARISALVDLGILPYRNTILSADPASREGVGKANRAWVRMGWRGLRIRPRRALPYPYSQRNASMTSVVEARRAGIQMARKLTARSRPVTAP